MYGDSEAAQEPRLTRDVQSLRVQGPIMYASWFGDLGGGELRMLDHLKLTRVDPSSLFVVIGADGPLAARLDGLGVPHAKIQWKHPGNWVQRQWNWYRAKARALQMLSSRQPSVLICNTWHDLETIGRAAASLGIPMIWRARADTFVDTDKWPPAKLAELVAFVNARVARVLTTTRYEARNMIACGVKADRVRVVPNGVDLQRYNAPADGQALRQELGVSKDTIVVAFVARMVPQKGYEILLDALGQLVRSGRDFVALVAGDTTLLESKADEYRASIQHKVAALNLGAHVRLMGARQDVPAIMNAADIFVLASLREPFGTTVIEAMASGLPVIASDLPGPRESAVDEETGLFFPAGDANALYTALCRLFDDEPARRSMGMRGRARAEELFSMNKYILAMDEEVIGVARRGALPAR